jgi:ParB-like nuclease domain
VQSEASRQPPPAPRWPSLSLPTTLATPAKSSKVSKVSLRPTARVALLQSLAVVPADVFKVAFPENANEIGDARYVVIGGNRRLAAARLAGLERLPILVNHKATTRKAILIAAATENVARPGAGE